MPSPYVRAIIFSMELQLRMLLRNVRSRIVFRNANAANCRTRRTRGTRTPCRGRTNAPSLALTAAPRAGPGSKITRTRGSTAGSCREASSRSPAFSPAGRETCPERSRRDHPWATADEAQTNFEDYCCRICPAFGCTVSFLICVASQPPPSAFTRYTELTICCPSSCVSSR